MRENNYIYNLLLLLILIEFSCSQDRKNDLDRNQKPDSVSAFSKEKYRKDVEVFNVDSFITASRLKKQVKDSTAKQVLIGGSYSYSMLVPSYFTYNSNSKNNSTELYNKDSSSAIKYKIVRYMSDYYQYPEVNGDLDHVNIDLDEVYKAFESYCDSVSFYCKGEVKNCECKYYNEEHQNFFVRKNILSTISPGTHGVLQFDFFYDLSDSALMEEVIESVRNK